MGLMKWAAKKGNVGGTARWAAQGYKFFSQGNASIRGPELYKALIRLRFSTLRNAQQEGFLLAVADKIIGLRGLVVAVLTIEAGFAENTDDNKEMFMEIIDEELLRCGVPNDIVYKQ